MPKWLSNFFGWFTGHGRYMRLVDCLDGDVFWISLTVVLTLAVAGGYLVIARHWARNQGLHKPGPAREALQSLKGIFLFCGLCGYVSIPIKLFWPAWRLFDIILAILVFYTWKFALGSKSIRVVYDQLNQSEQLAETLLKTKAEAKRRSMFLSAISHDVRTPLNGLSLQTQVAEMAYEDGDGEVLAQSLREIRACAHTAAELLGEFLEIGRIDWSLEGPRCLDVDLDDVIRMNLARNLANAQRKGLTLEAEVPTHLQVQSDRRLIDRILQNLVENAMKYTHEGSIKLSGLSVPGGVEIDVTDTGIGIASENADRVFDDFYQVGNLERDRSKGFGLGLSIAQRMAHQLGGELRVESHLGQGSRFTLCLPLSCPRPPAETVHDLLPPGKLVANPHR